MEQDRSFGYTLILGTCILLCLVLVGKMMLQHAQSAPMPNTKSSITQQQPADTAQKFTETDLAQLLTEALAADFPVRDAAVSIHADGAICVTCNADKKLLQQYLTNSSIRSALVLLPAQIPLQLDAMVQTQTNPPALTAVNLQMGDLQLPAAALPAGVLQACNQALTQMLSQSGYQISDIQFEEGAMILNTPS